MRVMQLHIEELMRQTEQRERELHRTQAQLREQAKQRAVQQPQERKLFAKLEQQQAELTIIACSVLCRLYCRACKACTVEPVP